MADFFGLILATTGLIYVIRICSTSVETETEDKPESNRFPATNVQEKTDQQIRIKPEPTMFKPDRASPTILPDPVLFDTEPEDHIPSIKPKKVQQQLLKRNDDFKKENQILFEESKPKPDAQNLKKEQANKELTELKAKVEQQKTILDAVNKEKTALENAIKVRKTEKKEIGKRLDEAQTELKNLKSDYNINLTKLDAVQTEKDKKQKKIKNLIGYLKEKENAIDELKEKVGVLEHAINVSESEKYHQKQELEFLNRRIEEFKNERHNNSNEPDSFPEKNKGDITINIKTKNVLSPCSQTQICKT